MAIRTIPIGYAADSRQRAETVLAALSLLVPWDLAGQRKVRYGVPGDGSYVLIDRCRPSQDVLSFGIGPTVNFDLAMAEQGHRSANCPPNMTDLPGYGRVSGVRQA